MFIIFGQKAMRIKRYTIHQQACPHCGAFDMDVKVYHAYFHFFYVPIFPVNDRTSTLICNSCGRQSWINSLLSQYEKSAKKSIFLYTGLILIGGLITWIAIANHHTQLEKKAFVSAPREGDVYTMRHDDAGKTSYYFLKIVTVGQDSVSTQHSNLVYHQYVSKPDFEDYFVEDDINVISKQQLLKLLEDGDINAVERH